MSLVRDVAETLRILGADASAREEAIRLEQALLVLVLATSVGCTMDVLPVRLVVDTPEDRDLVGDAARDAFGLEVEFVEDSHGAVTIDVVHALVDAPIGTVVEVGHAYEDRCEPFLWARPFDMTVAHEIGHTLGLRHRKKHGNLMTPQPTGWDVTEVQMDAVWLGVERLHSCGLTAAPR